MSVRNSLKTFLMFAARNFCSNAARVTGSIARQLLPSTEGCPTALAHPKEIANLILQATGYSVTN
jgi:hypothetical protein